MNNSGSLGVFIVKTLMERYGQLVDHACIFFWVAGVFTGSALWAPIIIFCVPRIKSLLSVKRLRLIQKIFGITIIACGFAVGGAPFLSSPR